MAPRFKLLNGYSGIGQRKTIEPEYEEGLQVSKRGSAQNVIEKGVKRDEVPLF